MLASAAEFLFERSHTSNMRAEANKEQIRRENAIPKLCAILRTPCWEAKYQACSALSELAFRNEKNCITIVRTPGALDAVVELIRSGNGGTMQEDAALVVNNCAAFSEKACPAIVACPGLVDSLKCLAIEGSFGAKNVAVGAINCLSRCPAAKRDLMASRVVEEALTPVLREPGSGDKHEARLARAAMAMANLTGNVDSGQALDNYHNAIATTVKILGFALDGRSWAGIHFAPYSVVYPLNNLAANPDNRSRLVECGLLELLARCMNDWQDEAHHADETLQLCLELAAHLKGPWEWQQRMREGGVVRALQKVRDRSRGESQECGRRAEELLDDLLQGHLAVWMSQHQRLGAQSSLHCLDEYVTGIILDHAFGGHLCALDNV